ncbi:MAG TPA: methylmalonyl Co-A mutase-associated GTPase MeaB [Thermoplasmata archaeon]|nr:methylmalonyl Co-A mutase-associated GTPase MeaB [Thermoplasmata archaeon]
MKGTARLPKAARDVRRGDRRALARLITAVENGDRSAEPTLRALYPFTGRAHVIGITGPLGVGKSSVINELIAHLRGLGRTVAVLAVDPSSPFSGGSVLGDRIRLDRAPEDSGVFIRSMASRGHAGGVAIATRASVRLLEAAGFEIVLVETVGSGQVDVEIRDVATTSVVVLVPHLGDEVQTMKAGLFEIADVFCVNKSDLPGAERAEKHLTDLAGTGRPRDGWTARIVATSTSPPRGIDWLWEAIAAHEAFLDAGGRRSEEERRRLAKEIAGRVRDRVGERILEDPALRGLVDRVLARTLDPETAARKLYAERFPSR